MALEEARTQLAAPAAPAREVPTRPGWGRAVVKFAQRRTLGAAGGVVVILMILTAIFAGVIAPYDPKDTSFLEQLKAPSAQHLLGTDSTNSRPMPFRLKTCSVTTRPPIRKANSVPMMVMTGSMAFFKVCLTTTMRSCRPLAQAVRT